MRAAVRPFALPRPDRLKGAAAEWRGRPGGPDLGGREAKSFRPKQKMREREKEGGREARENKSRRRQRARGRTSASVPGCFFYTDADTSASAHADNGFGIVRYYL